MKKLLFLLIILVFASNATAVLIPFTGNVTILAQITELVLPAQFSGNGLVERTSANLKMQDGANSLGTIELKMVFTPDFASGSVFIGNINTTIDINAIDETATISNYNPILFSLLGEFEFPTGGAYVRTYTVQLTQNGKKVGDASIDLTLRQAEETQIIATILQGDSAVGTANVKVDMQSALETINIVSNRFAGSVTTANNKPVVSGNVQIVTTNGIYSTKINPVGAEGLYGIMGDSLIVQGILGSEAAFFVEDEHVKTVTLTSAAGVRREDLQVGRISSESNFEDWDFDGVPNSLDVCPLTYKSIVNAQGCSCVQLMALHNGKGTCVVTPDKGPVWIAPPPPKPPKPECLKADTCLAQGPYYCDENKTVVPNCEQCGCASGFECNPTPEGLQPITDGNCYQIIPRVNLTCIKNRYEVGKQMDCTTLGPTFIDFFANDSQKRGPLDFISVKVKGIFGEDDIEKEVKQSLAAMKLCIDTENLGCVKSGLKCPGQDMLGIRQGDIYDALQQEIESVLMGDQGTPFGAAMGDKGVQAGAAIMGYALMASAILGPAAPGFFIIGYLGSLAAAELAGSFLNVDVSYRLNTNAVQSVALRYVSPCDDLLLKQEDACIKVLQSGNTEDKLDLLFIGDGYSSYTTLNNTITKLMDYSANNSGTKNEGVFSRAPFKGNIKNFNIWMMPAPNMTHDYDENFRRKGLLPKRDDIFSRAIKCPQTDVIIVVSKDAVYETDCGSKELSVPCLLSLKGEPVPGRALLRILGKGIGGLADEYYLQVEQLENIQGRVKGLDYLSVFASNNCKKNRGEASSSWGGLVGLPTSTAGYFDSCGGACDERCGGFVRPTKNSLMNNVTARCTTNCKQGPPYDPFYIVNEQAIIVGIENLEPLSNSS